MNRQKERNVKLDLLKGFACIGVVFIHVCFPGVFGDVVNYIFSCAVPIFYMIAGYYAWGKDAQTVKRRLLKISKIFAAGYLLFFAYCALAQAVNHTFGIWLRANFNWNALIKCIVFCTVDFAIPLWYLLAMVELYIFWYFIVKYQKELLVLKLMPLLFALLILSTFYCEAMHLAWFRKINFLTQALPWFLLGYYTNTDAARKFRAMESLKISIFLLAGCAITVAPNVTELPYSVSLIGLIPYAFGLFILALKNPADSVCRAVEYIGKRLSLHIYLLHTPVAGVLGAACRRVLGIDTDAAAWLWAQPLLVVLCTVLAAWILDTVSQKVARRKCVASTR